MGQQRHVRCRQEGGNIQRGGGAGSSTLSMASLRMVSPITGTSFRTCTAQPQKAGGERPACGEQHSTQQVWGRGGTDSMDTGVVRRQTAWAKVWGQQAYWQGRGSGKGTQPTSAGAKAASQPAQGQRQPVKAAISAHSQDGTLVEQVGQVSARVTDREVGHLGRESVSTS